MNILSKFQLPSSYCLGLTVPWIYFHRPWVSELMNELINYGGDCRIAPATPGLLNIVDFKCPRGNVCVLLLMIANFKAMNTSLSPFNLIKQVPWIILYARYKMAANFFLLFGHLNSQAVHSGSLYKFFLASGNLINYTLHHSPNTCLLTSRE